MKVKEIRALGVEALKEKRVQLQEELFRLKIRKGSGPLESPVMLSRLRKDIARINTVLREKEVAG